MADSLDAHVTHPLAGDPTLQVDESEGEIIAPATAALPVERELVEPGRHLPPLIRALRPVQWSKNLLVFAALLFSLNVFEFAKFAQAVGAFVVFCAVSSAVYLLNDVRDRDMDAHHPVKRTRPIAAGQVTPGTALSLSAALGVGGVAAAYLIDPELALVVSAYLALMIAYSYGLKRVVLLDVIMISIGFVLRAAAGAVAIDVPISPWLYICSMLLALMLGFGKRRHELLMLRDAASQHRANLGRLFGAASRPNHCGDFIVGGGGVLGLHLHVARVTREPCDDADDTDRALRYFSLSLPHLQRASWGEPGIAAHSRPADTVVDSALGGYERRDSVLELVLAAGSRQQAAWFPTGQICPRLRVIQSRKFEPRSSVRLGMPSLSMRARISDWTRVAIAGPR